MRADFAPDFWVKNDLWMRQLAGKSHAREDSESDECDFPSRDAVRMGGKESHQAGSPSATRKLRFDGLIGPLLDPNLDVTRLPKIL
jgi:hypothetical protein